MLSDKVRRAVAALLRKLLSSKLLQYPLRALLYLWLFLKRRIFGLENSRRSDGGRKPGGNAGVLPSAGPSPDPRLRWGTEGDCTRSSSSPAEPKLRWVDEEIGKDTQVVSASQVPLSALGLNLGQGSPRLLQPTDVPSTGSVSANGDTFLHPYAWPRHNASKSSQDIGLISLSDRGQDREDGHLSVRSNVSQALPGHLRPTSRASSRAISRIASRAHSRASYSTRAPSRSRSQAPSPSPQRSAIELAPQYSPATPSPRLAVPVGNTIPPPSFQSCEFTPKCRQKMYPVMEVLRYERKVIIPNVELQCIIPPLTTSFPLEGAPPDWVACTHPEGALYFYHPGRRIYTEANLCEPDMLLEVLAFAEQIEETVRDDNIVLPEDAELVLDLEDDEEGGRNWCYYYASDSRRTLFWLHSYDASDILQAEVRGVSSLAHIKHELEGYYWQHIEQFPYNHKPSEDVLKHLTSIILHLSIDQMTSPSSTSAYTAEELQKMIALIRGIRDIGYNEHTAAVVGRLMYMFAHHRFLHFHGQYGARLCRDQSIYGESTPARTLLIRIMSPIFFNAPDVHLRGLESLWIDGLINQLPWSNFIQRLKVDWQEFVLYATVMLNANVAFLTIPDVDPGPGQSTLAKVCSFISIITSVGSIILGLLLVRHHRVRPRETAQEVVDYLLRRKHPTLGLETLAILYSLPYALLMWAMLTFLLAFAFECFIHHGLSAYVLATFWVVIGLLILWCIYTLWDSEAGESAWMSLGHTVEHLLSRVQQRLLCAPKLSFGMFSRRHHPHVAEDITPRSARFDIEP
ncbi:hypothetical protein BKA93DRAFT_829121 [Sparassis latifolia]